MTTSRATRFAAIVAVCAVLTDIRVPFAAEPLFLDVAADVGLKFTHVNGAAGQYYMPEQMGPGAALFDYDNDGDLDVFLVQGGVLDPPPKEPMSEAPTSRLFRNDTAINSAGRRQLRFTDVTGESGLAFRSYGMGAAAADYDGDGYVDLFVTTFGPDKLFRNTGKGTFADVTGTAGVGDNLWSTSAAFLDYDRDGYLDLFVANYLDFSLTGNKVCQDSVGTRDYCSPRSYVPVPDRLYRNLGNGKFSDVTESAGISKADGAGLGVAIGDYNADGWLDVYVANDANPNQLWINKHDGTFRDEGMLSGAAVNAAGNPEGSMGIASGDFDQDGDEDIFITNIIGETFVLYENDGRGNFEDVRNKVGIAAPTAAFTGFGTDWFDYDNDGWLDLFVANGAVNIVEAQRGQPTPFRMKNQLFRNSGKGRFEETSAIAGPVFARAEISRAAAFGDVDNDGDVDILVTNNGGPVRLLINQSRGEACGTEARRPLPSNSPRAAGTEPFRLWRMGRRGARRTGHAVAPRQNRRQLSVRERSPAPFRPRSLDRHRRGGRAVARRAIRTLEGSGGGPSPDAEARLVQAMKTGERLTAVALTLALAMSFETVEAQPLRASAVKVDITPATSQWLSGYQERKSDGVLDSIYHRVVALDAGGTPLYLISSDLCLFSPTLYDTVTTELQKEAGIDPKHVLWSVTHSHATPEIGPPDMYKALLGRSDHDWDREYTARVTRALIDAVRDARDKLEPARISFGSGVSFANINRRAKDVDGRVSLGLNPDGPVDRQINLIRLDRPDGRLMALIANYAMHGTVMSGQNLKISGDGPGTVTAYLEDKLAATVLFINGAAGNIAPIYSVYPNAQSGHLSQFRVLLGDRILTALATLAPGTANVSIRHAEQIVETPRRDGLEWPPELAAYATTGERPLVRLPLRFVRINDTVIWSAPVEMFCEIAMDVRERSPFAHTFYFGYTNGWFGYLPTAKAYEEGGYEPRTSPFSPQVEADVTRTVTTFLREFRR